MNLFYLRLSLFQVLLQQQRKNVSMQKNYLPTIKEETEKKKITK